MEASSSCSLRSGATDDVAIRNLSKQSNYTTVVAIDFDLRQGLKARNSLVTEENRAAIIHSSTRYIVATAVVSS